MKKITFILVLIYSSLPMYSQNKPISDQVAYQTSFVFDNPIDKSTAIEQFITKMLDGKGYVFESK